ncbi:MAG TPA: tetratricopeptide repeat protein [Gammaproteobacteria bacterium]|nr:tetratricopeptide repeat protein [Gammaproteobacteria bacterium]
MKAYSTREVAELLAIPAQRVRTLARAAGLLDPQRSSGKRHRFSFQDVVLLRTAKGLAEAKLDPRRIWRAIKALSAQLPPDRPLSAVRVQVEGTRVIVRDNNTAWEPESGQTILDFSVQELSEKVAPMVRESVRRALHTAATAEQWFEAALECEQMGANAEAESAYRSALHLQADHVAATINLGRLRHVARALPEAEELYRQALRLEPDHPTARFNLGVVLEDRGATQDAIAQYKEAVRLDPRVADVHYNLARLYQQTGDQQAALRHFSRFKKLTRPSSD